MHVVPRFRREATDTSISVSRSYSLRMPMCMLQQSSGFQQSCCAGETRVSVPGARSPSHAGWQGKADAAAMPSPNTASACSKQQRWPKMLLHGCIATSPWLWFASRPTVASQCPTEQPGSPCQLREGSWGAPGAAWLAARRGCRRLMVLAQHISLTSLSTCDGCACVWCLLGTHPPQAAIHPSALLVGDSFFMRRFPKSILCPLSKPVASVPGWIWPGAAQSWVCAELPFS